MRRLWCVVVALQAGGCTNPCDEHDPNEQPLIDGSIHLRMRNADPEIPPVRLAVWGSRTGTGHESSNGPDQGTSCVYPEIELIGTATATPDGGDPVPLEFATGQFVGLLPYAASYTVTLREDSGQQHVETPALPALFTTSFTYVPGSGPRHDLSDTPGATIPDGLPAGAWATVSVDGFSTSGFTSAADLAVTVDITHPYRGDLAISLFKDNTLVKTLAQNVGGSTANVHDTFTLTRQEIGDDVTGLWSVKVVDTKTNDVGTLDKVTFSFGPEDDLAVESTPPPLAGDLTTLDLVECGTTRGIAVSSTTSASGWTILGSSLKPYNSNIRITVTHNNSIDGVQGQLQVYGDLIRTPGTTCQLL